MSYQTGRLTNYLGLGLVILGLAFVDRKLPLPIARPLPPGLFIIGIGVALAFVDTPLDVFLNGEVEAGGWGEVFQDMLFVAIGVLVALASLIEWFWPGWVLSRVETQMGLGQLLAGAGVVVAITGAIHLYEAVATRGSGWTFLLTIPIMLAWGAILLLGLAMAGLGVVQLAAPGTVEAWVRGIIPPIPTPPIPGG